jgi:extracellular elastinolytic metalloproteinase
MNASVRRALAVLAAVALLTSTSRAQNDQSYEPGRARTYAGNRAKPLTGPSNASPVAVIAQYLRGIGRSVDVRSLVANGPAAARDGVANIRVEQRIGGVRLYGVYARAALSDSGELLHLIENLAVGSPGAVGRPRVSESDAIAAALRHLYPDEAIATGPGRRQGDTVRYEKTAFFHDEPTVTRVAYPAADGSFGAGFVVHTWTEEGNQLHETLIGAGGEVLFDEARTSQDSYNVFAINPNVSSQNPIAGPGSGNTESPNGWLSGAQTTRNIKGNNVNAYLDTDANNTVDGGGVAAGSDFLASASFALPPSDPTNKAVSVQNLFYLNNLLHDTLYALGFDEAAGNFQENNFKPGGAEGDSVNAEAQDGSGTDNANFATPADGSNPRMQMYLWNGGPDHEVIVDGGATYAALGAAFGSALTTVGLNDNIAVASPADACATVGTAVSGKIALVDRGTCDFTKKVLNAQTAGAVAVIVANNVASNPDEVFAMGGSNRRIKIPSVMVSYNSGAALKASLLTTPLLTATLRKKTQIPHMIDASLDADIVFHEYGHGLTWRMIGGMSGPLAGALGEGASDTLAMFMTAEDDYAHADVIGEYSALNSNGIRRQRYNNYDGTYSDVTGASVHDDGEIYAATMWDLMELFGEARRGELFADWVDGMNYIPSTPAYEDMRDGLLQAAEGSSSDQCLVWQAFAARGIGQGADGSVVGKRLRITESFANPCLP